MKIKDLGKNFYENRGAPPPILVMNKVTPTTPFTNLGSAGGYPDLGGVGNKFNFLNVVKPNLPKVKEDFSLEEATVNSLKYEPADYFNYFNDPTKFIPSGKITEIRNPFLKKEEALPDFRTDYHSFLDFKIEEPIQTYNFPVEKPDLDNERDLFNKEVQSQIKNIFDNQITEFDELYVFFSEFNRDIGEFMNNFLSYLSNLQATNTVNLIAAKNEISSRIKEFEQSYRLKLNNLVSKIKSLNLSQAQIENATRIFINKSNENLDIFSRIANSVSELKVAHLIIVLEKEKSLSTMMERNNQLLNQLTMAKADLDRVPPDKPELTLKYNNLLRELEDRDGKIRLLNQERERFETTLKEQENFFKNEFSKYQRENRDLHDLSRDLESKINELKRENIEIQKRYAYLPTDLVSEANKKIEFISKYNQNEETIKKLTAELRLKDQQMNNYIQEANAEFQNLQNEKEKNFQLIRENEKKIYALNNENQILKQQIYVAPEFFSKVLEALNINPNSGNLTSDLNDAIFKWSQLKETALKMERNNFTLTEVNQKLEHDLMVMRQKWETSNNRNRLIENEIMIEKANIENLAKKKQEADNQLRSAKENFQNVNKYTEYWSSSLTALSIFVDESCDRTNDFLNNMISPFYSFFAKANAIKKVIAEAREKNGGDMIMNTQLPQSVFQVLYPQSGIVAFYQIYWSALFVNMQKVKSALLHQYVHWVQNYGYLNDAYQEERISINALLTEIYRHEAALKTKKEQNMGDAREFAEALNVGLLACERFIKAGESLLQNLKDNQKRIDLALNQIKEFIKHAKAIDEPLAFSNVVVNLYQCYLGCSGLNNFYGCMGYLYFVELYEFILLNQRKENVPHSFEVEVRTSKSSNGLYTCMIEGVDWMRISEKVMILDSTRVLNITPIQISISPIGIVAKIKLMLRNYMFEKRLGFSNESFTHTFTDCFLLELFFWKFDQVEDFKPATSCEYRTPLFNIKNNHLYWLADMDKNIINDCVENLNKVKVLLYFYDFISKMLMWIIQKVQSSYYFSTPNTHWIIEIMRYMDYGLRSDDLYVVLENFWNVHYMLCQTFALSIIFQENLFHYSPLQEQKFLISKMIFKFLRTEKIMNTIIRQDADNYVSDDFKDLLTSKNIYRPGDFRGMLHMANNKEPKCLPIVNQFIYIKRNGTFTEHKNHIDLIKIEKTNMDVYSTRRYPYEYLLDDSNERYFEGHKHNYDNNRRFSYFSAYSYLSPQYMTIQSSMTLNLATKQSVPIKPDPNDIYKKYKGGSLAEEKTRYEAIVKALEMPGYAFIQNLISIIFKIELQGVKFKAQYLPDFGFLPEVKKLIDDEYDMELTMEEQKIANFIYSDNMKNENERVRAIDCGKVALPPNVIKKDVWDALAQKLANYKQNFNFFTHKPIVDFVKEVKKYLTDNYMR